jgi:hypothetical protein
MNNIAFYGRIWSGDYKLIATVLGEWVKTENLDIKIRLGGEEIVYKDEQIYLYCYNATTNEGVSPSFLLEGNVSATLGEANILLQELLQLFKHQNIMSSFEYAEVTEDGEEVSDQFYVQ